MAVTATTMATTAAAAGAGVYALHFALSTFDNIVDDSIESILGTRAYFFKQDFQSVARDLKLPVYKVSKIKGFYNPDTWDTIPLVDLYHQQGVLSREICGQKAYEFALQALRVLNPSLESDHPIVPLSDEDNAKRNKQHLELAKKYPLTHLMMPVSVPRYRFDNKRIGLYNLDKLDRAEQILLFTLTLMGLDVELAGEWKFTRLDFPYGNAYSVITPFAPLKEGTRYSLMAEAPSNVEHSALLVVPRGVTTYSSEYFETAEFSLPDYSVKVSAPIKLKTSTVKKIGLGAAALAGLVALFYLAPRVARGLIKAFPDTDWLVNLFAVLEKIPNPFGLSDESLLYVTFADRPFELRKSKLIALLSPRPSDAIYFAERGVERKIDPSNIKFNPQKLTLEVDGLERKILIVQLRDSRLFSVILASASDGFRQGGLVRCTVQRS